MNSPVLWGLINKINVTALRVRNLNRSRQIDGPTAEKWFFYFLPFATIECNKMYIIFHTNIRMIMSYISFYFFHFHFQKKLSHNTKGKKEFWLKRWNEKWEMINLCTRTHSHTMRYNIHACKHIADAQNQHLNEIDTVRIGYWKECYSYRLTTMETKHNELSK